MDLQGASQASCTGDEEGGRAYMPQAMPGDVYFPGVRTGGGECFFLQGRRVTGRVLHTASKAVNSEGGHRLHKGSMQLCERAKKNLIFRNSSSGLMSHQCFRMDGEWWHCMPKPAQPACDIRALVVVQALGFGEGNSLKKQCFPGA
jgi:hypothetical protein